MSSKDLFSLPTGPQRVTLYYCKQCEMGQISGDYAPGKCTHCDSTDFYSEFDLGAPCNRHEEEENTNEL